MSLFKSILYFASSFSNLLTLYFVTASKAFVFDEINLTLGDSTVNPTLLVSQTVSRGKTTTKLYDFNDTPTGTVALTEGGFGVYYQTTVRNVTTWKRDNFDTNGVFKQTDSYSFAQLLADETTYNIDLNKDGSFV